MTQHLATPAGSGISRRQLIVTGSAALAASALGLAPTLAHADKLSDKLEEQDRVNEQIIETRSLLEQLADSYYKALEEHDAAQVAVEDAQGRIDQNSARIEELKAQISKRLQARYKTGDFGFADVLLGSTSFKDFTNRWNMLDRLNAADAALASQTKELRQRNEAEKADHQAAKDLAQQKMDEAKRLEAEAQDKIRELEDLYDKLSEEAKEILEREQAAALAAADFNHSVDVIGNPRNIEPTPEVVEVALDRMGCPYVWAAAGPDTFDCSGLVVWCYDKAGIPGLPHYTESLYALALGIGAVVPLADVEPGDVLYRPGHVGIAQGKGGMPYIHAPYTGALVRNTDNLAYSRFVCGLRFPRP